MTLNIYESEDLIVTRYVGPASEGPDRARWQFTSRYGDYPALNRVELRVLINALINSDLRSHEPPRNSGEGTAVNGPMPLGEKDELHELA